jgi:cystathionine gamma-lyase
MPPIVTASTYSQMGPGEHHGYQYSTYKNPTRNSLEQCLASLDNAKYAIAFCAGGSALTSIMTLFEIGDNIISSKKFYAGDFEIWKTFGKLGIETKYVDFDNLKNLEGSLDENTKMVWIESPTNPLLNILDIKLIADIVHSKSNAFLVVDNTFLTPYFQRPLELGADLVSYSVSKFISGHSDVIGGAITTNNEQLYEKIKTSQMSTGVAASPFNCYLINRSLRTLSVRMEKHFENSYIVAKFLEMHPKVAKVNHPALKSHKGHKIAIKQSYGHSGIFSFYLNDDSIEKSRKFLRSLKLIIVGESLGGTETMASLPWLMSHVSMSDEEKLQVGITVGLIRITVGLEDVEDIVEDIQLALEEI